MKLHPSEALEKVKRALANLKRSGLGKSRERKERVLGPLRKKQGELDIEGPIVAVLTSNEPKRTICLFLVDGEIGISNGEIFRTLQLNTNWRIRRPTSWARLGKLGGEMHFIPLSSFLGCTGSGWIVTEGIKTDGERFSRPFTL